MNFFKNYTVLKISILCALISCTAFCIGAETSIKSAFIIGTFLLGIALISFIVSPWLDDFQ